MHSRNLREHNEEDMEASRPRPSKSSKTNFKVDRSGVHTRPVWYERGARVTLGEKVKNPIKQCPKIMKSKT